MDDKKKKEYERPELEIVYFEGDLATDPIVNSGEGGWDAGNMEGWWH